MAGQLQFRRGPRSNNDNFTGVEGEITVNLSDGRIRIHDGVTQGGFVELINQDDLTDFSNGLGSAAWLDATFSAVDGNVARYGSGGRLKAGAATDSDDVVNKLYGSENYQPKLLNNTDATTDPTANDDVNDGYSIFSKWINQSTGDVFECLDNTAGAAVWVLGNITADDLGTAAVRDVGVGSTQIPLNSDLSTVAATGSYSDLLNVPTLDNYVSWSYQVDGDTASDVVSGKILNFQAGTNVSITRDADNIVFSSTDTNTEYTAGSGLSLTGTELSLSGVSYTQPEKDKLSGIEAGAEVNVPSDLSVTLGATSASVSNTNGSGFTVPSATTSLAGVLSSSDKVKLDSVESGADVTDAGNVASAGAVMDSDFSTNGLMKRTSAGSYTSITDNSTNWDTAYSWGDHALAGYALDSSLASVATTGSYNDLTDKPTLNINNWDTAYSWGDHSLAGYADATATQNALDTKVDKVAGKGLSENDLTDGRLAAFELAEQRAFRREVQQKVQQDSVLYLDFQRNIGYNRVGINPNDWHGAIDGGSVGDASNGHPGSATALLDYSAPDGQTGVDLSGNVQFCPADTPALVAKDGKVQGLQVAPSSTNLLLWSEDLTNSYWDKNGDTTATLSTAVEDIGLPYYLVSGLLNSTGDSSGNDNLRFQQTLPSTGLYSLTLYVYSVAPTNNIIIRRRAVDGSLDEQNNAPITQGWNRVVFTDNYDGVNARFIIATTNGGFYATGFQLEEGYPTPYIPTTTSQVTRGNIQAALPPENIPLEQGFLFFDGVINQSTVNTTDILSFGSGNVSTDGVFMRSTGNGNVDFVNSSGGTLLIDSPSTQITLGQRHKILCVYSGTSLKGFIDGVKVFENTTDFVPPTQATNFELLGNIIASTISHNGTCRVAALSSSSLTDSEAIALTTLEE
jgi:hypothetical protein